MKKIAIVGAGNFGANAACYLAEQNLGHVVLIDSKEGLARGKALDLMEAAPVRGFNVQIDGADDLSMLAGADIIVIAAGVSRGKETSEEGLYQQNLTVMRQVLGEAKKLAPQAIIIIQREPTPRLVRDAVKEFGLDPKRVIGLTGLIEAARFRHFMARALDASPLDASVMVLGGPGKGIIPVIEFANISGIPVSELLSQKEIDEVTRQTQTSGEEIIGGLKITSAYYTPAAALAELVQALVRDKKRYLPVTVTAQGEYGLNGIPAILPALIGAGGVEKILEIQLNGAQKQALGEVVMK